MRAVEAVGVPGPFLARELARRSRNLVAFAGDHLIAGSNGSGAFWVPLHEADDEPLGLTATGSR